MGKIMLGVSFVALVMKMSSCNAEDRASIVKTVSNCERLASRNCVMNFIRKFEETVSVLGISRGGVGRK
jgi:hypothetical protein